MTQCIHIEKRVLTKASVYTSQKHIHIHTLRTSKCVGAWPMPERSMIAMRRALVGRWSPFTSTDWETCRDLVGSAEGGKKHQGEKRSRSRPSKPYPVFLLRAAAASGSYRASPSSMRQRGPTPRRLPPLIPAPLIPWLHRFLLMCLLCAAAGVICFPFVAASIAVVARGRCRGRWMDDQGHGSRCTTRCLPA
jgi:hypothetical protein